MKLVAAITCLMMASFAAFAEDAPANKTRTLITSKARALDPHELLDPNDPHKRSRAGTERIIQRSKPLLRVLYQIANMNNPSVRGSVTVEFTILADGNVTNCRAIDNDTGSPKFAKTAEAHMRGVRFPALDVEPMTLVKRLDFENTPVESVDIADPDRRSRFETEAVFNSRKEEIYVRYLRVLKTEPALHGVVTLEFTILPDGRVADCRVISNSTGSAPFAAEVAEVAANFRYPMHDVKSLTVSKPIDFQPPPAK